MPNSPDAVFINVPFDRGYKKLFDALIFAVHDCGFVARAAREQDDGSQMRNSRMRISSLLAALLCANSRMVARHGVVAALDAAEFTDLIECLA